MTIEQMRERKQELGYTYEQIADLSGVPLGTVQKVFGGVTASPRYDTLRALERVFQKKEPMYVKESALPYEAEARREKRQGEYTVEDYRALPEDQRMELIFRQCTLRYGSADRDSPADRRRNLCGFKRLYSDTERKVSPDVCADRCTAGL